MILSYERQVDSHFPKRQRHVTDRQRPVKTERIYNYTDGRSVTVL